ncbi:hypothetical protein [Methylobacterium iners]|uniref:Uncharacterized protein n=1 Tax=Methylobacterium iners TaxID=418707 RepID=A0ABQ4RRT3_9HYPH|nr:hypothetical protein [Methylobacterium iners]GJD92887.1 hypothetical protein OCOJLMKI_0070 [Methylobacterium iners]
MVTVSFTAADPRDPDGERTLDIEFTIDSYGCPGNTFGLPEDCYPAEPAEISVASARDITGANVLSLLTTDQREAIETEILERHDFDRSHDYDPREDWF